MNAENRLGSEKSPYLLQHKDNPVNWYAWGDEAFERAAREDKPIFLSIGYSTCYWCHVMEKDSFEEEEVAGILNEYFISIKVDREERPDLDKVYMDAVVALTGRGGWPLSAFLTPKRDVFWGGTFFFREQFKSILRQIHAAWVSDRDRVMQSAGSLEEFLTERREPCALHEKKSALVELACRQLSDAYDEAHGGFGGAPKFPPSQQCAFLLMYAAMNEGENGSRARKMALGTLMAMAHGGIFDHTGGGFHRYSVDGEWKVPHFEKMLYDNALLAAVYLDACLVSDERVFERTAADTLEYCIRDMIAPEKGFFSAEDAGEVQAEGDYYVWRDSEIREILDRDHYNVFASHYTVSPEGNFENGRCILARRRGEASAEEELIISRALLSLFEYRTSNRIRPEKDDKILAEWNGLLITALCRGYQVFGTERYLSAASACADFIMHSMRDSGGHLNRRYRDGEARFGGVLEDYSMFIQALIDLYESDSDEKWLRSAVDLQNIQDSLFRDEKNGGYFISNAEDVPKRKKEYTDGAIPSGNSVALSNLLRLHALFPDRGFGMRAKEVLCSFGEDLMRHPAAFSKALQAVQLELSGPRVFVLAGSRHDAGFDVMRRILHRAFVPGKVIAFAPADGDSSFIPITSGKGPIEGKPAVFICEGETCGPPVVDPEELKNRL